MPKDSNEIRIGTENKNEKLHLSIKVLSKSNS